MSARHHGSIRFRALLLMMLIALVGMAAQPREPTRTAPRFWDDCELADWATPIAALGVRPSHFSEREDYAAPEGELVRTYPVYFPGREPEGYWDMLRAQKPEPLIAPGERTDAEWIESGRHVFEEMDVPAFRNTDSRVIAMARSAASSRAAGAAPRRTAEPDSTCRSSRNRSCLNPSTTRYPRALPRWWRPGRPRISAVSDATMRPVSRHQPIVASERIQRYHSLLSGAATKVHRASWRVVT